MINQYKPTKPQKTKKEKVAKTPRTEKTVKINSSIHTIKLGKQPKSPKKAKATKAPKTEKAVAFKHGKVEKATKFDASAITKKQIKPVVAVMGILAVLVVVAVVSLITFTPDSGSSDGTDIKRITISSLPEKMEYYTDQIASYTGLKVLVTQKNDDSYTVEAKHCQITGFDSSAPTDRQNITVTYQGVSTSFDIIIKERPQTVKVLKSITMDTLPKTEYKQGDSISIDGGMILCVYQDGTTKKIKLAKKYVYGVGEIDGLGTYTLTVKYEEGGVTAETTYTITVTE